jgi:peroxiredoxin
MKEVWRTGLIVAVALAAGLAGFYARDHAADEQPAGQISAASAGAAEALLKLELPDAAGRLQALEQWRGKLIVANFWATWCPPCLREIPDFSAVSRGLPDTDVQFVGISIDSPENVARFATEQQVPYPLLVAPPSTLEIAAKLGNSAQALPFTVILGRDGNLAFVKLGTLSKTALEGKIRSLMGG